MPSTGRPANACTRRTAASVRAPKPPSTGRTGSRGPERELQRGDVRPRRPIRAGGCRRGGGRAAERAARARADDAVDDEPGAGREAGARPRSSGPGEPVDRAAVGVVRSQGHLKRGDARARGGGGRRARQARSYRRRRHQCPDRQQHFRGSCADRALLPVEYPRSDTQSEPRWLPGRFARTVQRREDPRACGLRARGRGAVGADHRAGAVVRPLGLAAVGARGGRGSTSAPPRARGSSRCRVAVTALLTALGGAAPVAWVIVARTGAVLCGLVLAFGSARGTCGHRAAGVLAGVGVALCGGSLGSRRRGGRETGWTIASRSPLAEAGAGGHYRRGAACGVGCALLRVEAWPFLLAVPASCCGAVRPRGPDAARHLRDRRARAVVPARVAGLGRRPALRRPRPRPEPRVSPRPTPCLRSPLCARRPHCRSGRCGSGAVACALPCRPPHVSPGPLRRPRLDRARRGDGASRLLRRAALFPAGRSAPSRSPARPR